MECTNNMPSLSVEKSITDYEMIQPDFYQFLNEEVKNLIMGNNFMGLLKLFDIIVKEVGEEYKNKERKELQHIAMCKLVMILISQTLCYMCLHKHFYMLI